MLESISWKEYWLTIGVIAILYYGWWFVKYAATFGWGRSTRWRRIRPLVSGQRVNLCRMVMGRMSWGWMIRGRWMAPYSCLWSPGN